MGSLSEVASGETCYVKFEEENIVIVFFCSNEYLCQFSSIVADIGGGSPSYSLIGSDIRY